MIDPSLEPSREPLTLTTVVVMPRGFSELTGSLAHLRAQTRREAIEVVLVHTPSHAHEIDPGQFAGFRGFTMVALAEIPAVAAAFAAACGVATGDVVALVEDHVLLDSGWAAATLDAHRAPCAAVAPVMANANPATAVSWANFLCSFHDAIGAARSGPVPCGPGHSTSYKRDVLRRYAPDLEAHYQSERAFHYRLLQDGEAIWHAPAARLSHLNISRSWQALRHAFLGGVLFGRYRSQRMHAAERLARTAGAAIVPFVRLRRILQAVLEADLGRMPVSTWGMLGVLLVGHAAGEACGYWKLVTDIEARYEFFELHRLECLREEERPLMCGA